ncbi:MAG: hypothetical protein Fur0016_06380 [Anaerolineales bacterium]
MNPHPNKTLENRFILSMVFTFAILIAEVVGGFWTGSLALLSDAAHVFMDIFALGLSYLALRLSALPADDRHTYGYHRLEVVAALINGVTLGAIAIEIFSESWKRWFNPEPIKSVEMLVIAVIGLVVNIVVAFVLGGHAHEHEHEADGVQSLLTLESQRQEFQRQESLESAEPAEDLNVRSAYLTSWAMRFPRSASSSPPRSSGGRAGPGSTRSCRSSSAFSSWSVPGAC